jgi:beta-glucosidase-like glycosyl hydrolase
VRGLQGPDLARGVAATGKHMVGHGLAEGGLNQAPAHVGPRELRDEQLLPFEAAIRDAGLASVMPAYCDVDGLPCHASAELLGAILRDEWGFDGIVVADYTAVAMLHTVHRMVPDLSEAGRLALAAGVDVELPRTEAYGAPLVAALDNGRLDEAALDAAVGRVPASSSGSGCSSDLRRGALEAALEALAADEARIGRELARRSMVLLRNEGVLPIAPGLTRVAVVADRRQRPDLLGDYSHSSTCRRCERCRARERARDRGPGPHDGAGRRAGRAAHAARRDPGPAGEHGGPDARRDRDPGRRTPGSPRRSRSPGCRIWRSSCSASARASPTTRRPASSATGAGSACSAASRSCSRPWWRPGHRRC